MKNDRRTKNELTRDLNSLRKQITRLEVDIKKKSRAEEKAKRTLTLQEALMEGSPEAMVLTEIDSRITIANSSFCIMTGFSPKELINKQVHKLYGGNDLRAFQKYYDRVIAGDDVLFKAVIRKSDSKKFEAEFNSRLIDIKGKPYVHLTIRDISSCKRIERELTIFDYAMRSVSEAITITDEHNTIIFVNDTFLHIYGYKREELIGLPVDILRIENTLPPVEEILASTLKNGWQGELINKRKDGSTFPIWLSTSVVRDESGIPLALIGVTTDITKRKIAEEALQKSEERYRTLINNQEEGIALVDSKEYFIFVNPAGEKIFGVLPGNLVGRNLADFVDSEQMKLISNETQKRIHGERNTYELEIKRPDGERRYLLVTGTSQIGKDGSFVGTFGVFHDITEQKQLEHARTKAEAALRASEEYFREVIENVSDIIFVVDRRGIIKYTSPSVERVLGYPVNEVVGKNAFQFIHPSEARRSLVVFWKSVRLKESSIHDTFCIVHKDGSERFLEGLGKNLLDHPSIAGFIMIVHDITENRRAEAALRESRDQLRVLAARLETIREKERKYIAHEMHEEFGQILSAVKIQMSNFARKYSRDEVFVSGVGELSHFIDEAIHSVRKISTDLWPGVLDLLGLTTAIEWQAKEFSKQYKIACKIEVPTKGVHLPEQSSIIIFRMLQDALKNVAEHAQASRVQIRLNIDAEYMELTIEDNGKGISEEQLNSPSSIGLVLLKERALSIGGSAEIKTTKGKGTTILIRTPLSK